MRLIDADALMKEFANFVAPSNRSDFVQPPNWNDAVSLVGSAPTIDPKKVIEDYCIPRNLMVVGVECFRLFTEPKDWNGWGNGCGRTYDFVPKKGKWLSSDGENFYCSECRHKAEDVIDGRQMAVLLSDFCPGCGARMTE